jgi:4-hydroxymandelate oxidase
VDARPEALEARARALLEPAVFDVFAGGADDELTLADNVAAWRRLRLRPRVLRGHERAETSTTALGAPIAAPIIAAPVAFQRLVHDDGEAETARGVAAAGSLLCVSTRATVTFEQIAAAAAGAPHWFQVYVLRDRDWTAELVRRAAGLGARALLLTADAPRLGRKRRDVRAAQARIDACYMPNRAAHLPPDFDPISEAASEQDPAVSLADIRWLAGLSGLPVLVKGVLRGDDARACVDAGAAGVVVSNHGGRQLDGAVATADALAEVAAAVGDRAEVYADGGIRSGRDVLCALALGARAVLLGRPVIWALATGGGDGVRALFDTLRDELELALLLAGCGSVEDVPADLVARR